MGSGHIILLPDTLLAEQICSSITKQRGALADEFMLAVIFF